MNEYKYEIGGKQYIQRPLVLGQLRQLLGQLKEVNIPASATPVEIMTALQDRAGAAIAVILCEAGADLRTRDMEQAIGDIEFSISPEQAMQVIEDFFACNPILSFIERANRMVGTITESLQNSKTTAKPLKPQSLSSQQET